MTKTMPIDVRVRSDQMSYVQLIISNGKNDQRRLLKENTEE